MAAQARSPLDPHLQLTKKRLEVVHAEPFRVTLQEFARRETARAPDARAPEALAAFSSAGALAEWIAHGPLASEPGSVCMEVEHVFHIVCDALEGVRESPGIPQTSLEAAREAAIALFCLAACRLVDTAEREQGAHGNLIRVPDGRSLVCAIIATAVAGGEIHIARESGVLKSRYAWELKLKGPTERPIEDFERALYVAVFRNKDFPDSEPQPALEGGEITPQMRADLQVRIGRLRRRSACIAVIIDTSIDEEVGSTLGKNFGLPIAMLDLTSTLLHMHCDRLVAYFNDFFDEVAAYNSGAAATASSPTPPSQPTPKEVHPMSSKEPTYQISGTGHIFQLTHGDHSPAQIYQQSGLRTSDLTELIELLGVAIRELPEGKARITFTAHARTIEHELRQEKPQLPVLQKALSNLQAGAEVIEQGGKIVELCTKAYGMLSGLFG